MAWVELSTKPYVRFEEFNDHEGEEWNFFINKFGNEKFLESLKNALDRVGKQEQYELPYKLYDGEIPEYEVDILVKYTPSGYMDTFQAVDICVSDDIISKLDATNSREDLENLLYKGRVFEE